MIQLSITENEVEIFIKKTDLEVGAGYNMYDIGADSLSIQSSEEDNLKKFLHDMDIVQEPSWLIVSRGNREEKRRRNSFSLDSFRNM